MNMNPHKGKNMTDLVSKMKLDITKKAEKKMSLTQKT
ncbi:MAG: hypothetical protein CM15mV25_0940 [uncultured marine virus]|nr:MAG: hypothetical protein CM15mV25_0940 [uncultured marine virus]